jgi:DNA polymerase-3 subunit gamma/tau
MGGDIFLGFLLSRLFGGGDKQPSARRPAEVFFPTSVPTAPPQALPPVATPAPTAPPQALPPQPAPTFPAAVLPPPPVDPGFKKAVEVWQVKPEFAAQGGVLVGELAQMSVAFAKSQFPNGWQPATQVTASERDFAIALTKTWTEGKVMFAGPETLPGIRAFRMVKHPKGQTGPAPTAVPTGPTVPAAAPPPATVPASFPAPPAAPPGPPPFVPQGPPPAPPDVPAAAPAAETSQGLQIVTVRPGEGLATVARRLGRPATAASAKELRAVNVPNGPNGVKWIATDLSDKTTGGIKKVNRKGGLQPGDQLFVPPQWGPVAPGSL